MRYQIMILLILISSSISQPSFAGSPKNVADLMTESQKSRAEISKKAGRVFPEAAKKLKELESSVNATIKDYEKASPEKGAHDEEKVAKFSYRFEPVFALIKIKTTADKNSCDKAKYQIESIDNPAKLEEPKLSEAAEESLKWLEILCK